MIWRTRRFSIHTAAKSEEFWGGESEYKTAATALGIFASGKVGLSSSGNFFYVSNTVLPWEVKAQW